MAELARLNAEPLANCRKSIATAIYYITNRFSVLGTTPQ